MSPRPVGVEEEFLLVRSAAGGLAAEGDAVVEVADAHHQGDASAAGNAPFEHELKREQVELGSAPHTSLDELGADLLQLRTELAAASHRRGAQLIAAGTSPVDDTSTTTDVTRYHRMMAEFGVVARQQLTCGMHVHVGIDGPDEGVAVLDRVRPWLSVLAALSVNSPIERGRDTGYASYRSVLWGQWPTSGPMEIFGDVAGYERACAELISSGAALDDGMIYFDARLSAHYPTVEIRVADVTPWVSDAVTIAALTRAAVETAAREWRAGVTAPPIRVDLLRAASWRAARWGLGGELVDVGTAQPQPSWTAVAALLDWTRAALVDAGDLERVQAGLAEIRRRGSGADLQRRAFAEASRSDDVLAALGAELLAAPLSR